MDEQARARALADWLRSQNYDPQIVHEKWGFAATTFFSDPAIGSSTPQAGSQGVEAHDE